MTKLPTNLERFGFTQQAYDRMLKFSQDPAANARMLVHQMIKPTFKHMQRTGIVRRGADFEEFLEHRAFRSLFQDVLEKEA